ncbi:MAG: N-6 DNA methylase [Chloroflexi bacterium]|nr:N-6 DNA methylase [Chloroflexota bacterium]
MASSSGQQIPSSGPEREMLRERGQFWTPAWVAEAMVEYVLAGGASTLFDPAVGAGAFFLAGKRVATLLGRSITLLGTEVDPKALEEARSNGLTASDLEQVRITNFLMHPPDVKFKGIVANPPYIRHHRIPIAAKEKMQQFGASVVGEPLDGRAGIHVYFLVRALQLLDSDGRLAFIMPADTCEGVFAPSLWRWITTHYCLDAVVTFSPKASPFPNVDTNPLIFMIRNTEPAPLFLWAKCLEPGTDLLKEWTRAGCPAEGNRTIIVHRRLLAEGLATGLSRSPVPEGEQGPALGEFATVLRGIATGANDYFFLTSSQAHEMGIPHRLLVPAIGRTRDIEGDTITAERLKTLDGLGRPTWLLSLDGAPMESFPKEVQAYLERGEQMGLPGRPLISSRRPWYKMEVRKTPPILFAYLGRRNARFIRNHAGVVPLTGFLCVYPESEDPQFVEKLWRVLSYPGTIANLRLIGKSYGGGAIKVEPRALERLPLPEAIVSEVNLVPPPRPHQLQLDSLLLVR